MSIMIAVLLGCDIVRDMLRDEENKAHTSLSASSSSNSLNSTVCFLLWMFYLNGLNLTWINGVVLIIET